MGGSTEGRCFICFDLLSRKLTEIQWKPVEDGLSLSAPKYSLQYLFRFLEMGKVTLNNSRLKAPMCAECAQLSEQFSELCRKLEKIQMEVVSGLEQIYGRLLQAGDEVKMKRTDQYQAIMADNKSNSMDGGLMMEALGGTVEELRKEAMERCFHKIRSLQPRVKVQRLVGKGSVFKRGKRGTNLSSQSSAIDKNFQQEGHPISLDQNFGRYSDSLLNHDIGNADFPQRCLASKKSEDSTKRFSSINIKTAKKEDIVKKYGACQVKLQDIFKEPFSSNNKLHKSEALKQEVLKVNNTPPDTDCQSEAIKNQAVWETYPRHCWATKDDFTKQFSSLKTAKKEDSIQPPLLMTATMEQEDPLKPSSPINTAMNQNEDPLKPSSSIKTPTKEDHMLKMQDLSMEVCASSFKPPTSNINIKVRKDIFVTKRISNRKNKGIKKNFETLFKEKLKAPKKRPVRANKTHCQPEPIQRKNLWDPAKQVPKPAPRMYKCSQCSLEFKSASNLTNHVRSEHLNYKYKCDVCNEVFKYQESISLHKQIHENIGFKCDNCDQFFTQKTKLTQHQRLKTCTKRSSTSKSFQKASTPILSNDLPHSSNTDAEPVIEVCFIKQEVEFQSPSPGLIELVEDDGNGVENSSELSHADIKTSEPPGLQKIASNLQLSSFHVKQEMSQYLDYENPEIDMGEIKLEVPSYPSPDPDGWSSVDVDDIESSPQSTIIIINTQSTEVPAQTPNDSTTHDLISPKPVNLGKSINPTYNPGNSVVEASVDGDNGGSPHLTNWKNSIMDWTPTSTPTVSTNDKTPILTKPGKPKPTKRKPTQKRETPQFKCHLCPLSFPNQSQRMRHHKSVHLKCNICGKNSRNEFAYKHHQQKAHKRFSFNCDVCGNAFNVISELLEHRRSTNCNIQTAASQNICRHCGDNFTAFGDLQEHWKAKHFTIRGGHGCDLCGSIFTWAHHLRHHKDHTHHKFQNHGSIASAGGNQTGDRYCCGHCDKMLSSVSDLRSHWKAVHFTEGVHGCDLCGQIFKGEDDLISHQGDIHGINMEKKNSDLNVELAEDTDHKKLPKEI